MARAEPLRYLDAAAFDRALPVARAIDAMAAVFREAAAGRVEASERQVLADSPGPGRTSLLLSMPAAWKGRAFATKVVGFVADNPAHGRPAVQGVAVLLDARTGAPRLLTDAGPLTCRRTAGMVGVATDRLASPRARVMGLVGTGALADDMIAAVHHVRPLERVLAFNRTPARAHELAARSPVPVTVVSDADAAASGCDVLVVATSARDVVVSDAAIGAGTHVNAVGCFDPEGRELAGATVGRAAIWVDGYEGALAEAGDLLLAAAEGHLAPLPDSLRGDLAQLVVDPAPRSGAAEITIFKSVGTAVADIGALLAASEAADELGLGTTLA